MSDDLALRAYKFAAKAHINQTRKYTGRQYIEHPVEVCHILLKFCPGATPEMIAAAYLHDVVEDCGITLEEIHVEFGSIVAEYVYWLTDTTTPSDGNRAARKAKERERLGRAPCLAQTIKCADLISNTISIAAHDPGFALVYLREKRLVLNVLSSAYSEIWNAANTVLKSAEAILDIRD